MPTIPNVLLVTATTGYQAQAFTEAIRRVGARPVIASDRCHRLDDPWRDDAIPVRFERPEEAVAAVLRRHREQPIQGMLACGDRAAVLGAHLAQALDLPGNPVGAVAACHDKFRFRSALAATGLPTPWFCRVPLDADRDGLSAEVAYPCVLKPLLLSGSRGVIRANTPREFREAVDRLRRLLRTPEIRQLHDPNADWIQLEGYLSGRELAVEGLLHEGRLVPLALFDKPDPLEGPFFEETIYVTPSRLPADLQSGVWAAVEAALRAIGLVRGPVHAEVRCTDQGVFVLEVAARPIGGLCSRVLRFACTEKSEPISLEELLVRAALGEPVGEQGWKREEQAAAVMMIPVPGHGILEGVDGVEAARAVPLIEAVEITARLRQIMTPLPEGCTYPGFIFARGAHPQAVEAALRTAHSHLRFTLTHQLPLLS